MSDPVAKAERYRHLERTGDALTSEEFREGWHYCLEWDGMLIHPDWPESDCCPCERICEDGEWKGKTFTPNP